MKNRKGFYIIFTINMLVLAFMLFAILQITSEMYRISRINMLLVEIVKYQAVNQIDIIETVELIAELTGLGNTSEKVRRGWYDALKENIGRKVPLVYPTGWADRYFNFLARKGVFSQLHEDGDYEGQAKGGDN